VVSSDGRASAARSGTAAKSGSAKRSGSAARRRTAAVGTVTEAAADVVDARQGKPRSQPLQSARWQKKIPLSGLAARNAVSG